MEASDKKNNLSMLRKRRGFLAPKKKLGEKELRPQLERQLFHSLLKT